jgi:hypothetical protein
MLEVLDKSSSAGNNNVSSTTTYSKLSLFENNQNKLRKDIVWFYSLYIKCNELFNMLMVAFLVLYS